MPSEMYKKAYHTNKGSIFWTGDGNSPVKPLDRTNSGNASLFGDDVYFANTRQSLDLELARKDSRKLI
ncbi:Hypothetical predicted protein [Cloeon dipterum]|uniref:Uncharacterized protein n=1 Tax=Cloeon dipterum TaxID=197152 RepID=A0A8S1D838_9INSE|nr:Hypothetical predicted protein [Cloeon dipterum]